MLKPKLMNMLAHTYKRFQREDTGVTVAFMSEEDVAAYCTHENEEVAADADTLLKECVSVLRPSVIWGVNYEKKDLVWQLGWTAKEACEFN